MTFLHGNNLIAGRLVGSPRRCQRAATLPWDERISDDIAR